MKILIVQDRLRSGGTERQSVLLANAFAGAGHSTTLLTFRPGGPLDHTVAPGVERRSLQWIDTGCDWLAPGLTRVAKAMAPDVLVAMGRMANCYAGTLQRRLGSTVVIGTMRTGKPLPALFRSSLRMVRHVVANSSEASVTLQARYGIDGAKISVIHNSLVFPPERPPATREDFRATLGTPAGAFVLLCVAMFRPEKNQRELVAIAAGLPTTLPWELWFAGDGPARRPCEALARSLGVADKVRFLGFRRDPSDLYAAADVAVHASGSESLSNFLIEAQAHGLPAVAYEAQGIRESMLTGRTGWVLARGDQSGFRAQLQQLAEAEPAERSARTTEARSFARSSFDPARQVRAYLDLFATLTASRR